MRRSAYGGLHFPSTLCSGFSAPSWYFNPVIIQVIPFYVCRLVGYNALDRSFLSSGKSSNNGSAAGRVCSEELRKICQDGQLVQALQAVELRYQRGIPVSNNILFVLIQRCIKTKDLAGARKVYHLITRTGMELNSFLGSHLIHMFASYDCLLEANQIFSRVSEPNIFVWSEIISAHVKHGQYKQAMELYHRMQLMEIKPNSHMFVAILKGCASAAASSQGKLVHSQIIKSGLDFEVFVGSALVDMYAKCGTLEDMHIAFDRLPKRDVVTWNAIITGFAQHGQTQQALLLFRRMQLEGFIRNVVTWNAIISGFAQHEYGKEALRLFNLMQVEGMQPNMITFVSVMNACSSVTALDQGKVIHADVIKKGYEVELFVGNALIDMYAKCGSLQNAQRVFDKLPERDSVTWNAMMAGYALQSHYRLTLQYFRGMQQEGLKPNDVTFVCLLSACSHMGLVEEGFHHFKSMSRDYSLSPKISHYTCMVDLLGRAGYLKDARHLLQSMPYQPDLVAWKSLLYHCNNYGQVKLGMRIFDHVIAMDSAEASAYMLMSNMYADADMCNDAGTVQELRKVASAWKKPGKAFIEVKNVVHDFTVGELSCSQRNEVLAKLNRLGKEMEQGGHVLLLDSILELVSDEVMESALLPL